jgi:hypothetical protein
MVGQVSHASVADLSNHCVYLNPKSNKMVTLAGFDLVQFSGSDIRRHSSNVIPSNDLIATGDMDGDNERTRVTFAKTKVTLSYYRLTLRQIDKGGWQNATVYVVKATK